MKKRILLTCFTVFCVSLLVTSMLLNTYATTQSDLDALNEKKNQVKNELDDVKEQKGNAEYDLEEIKGKVQSVESEIDKLNDEIDKLNESINTKEKEIKEEEEEIKRKDELLKQRMVALYEAGETSYLDVLFNSENLFDFLSSYSIIQQILETDTALIDELEQKKQQLENDKSNLENDKTKVETSRAEKEKKSVELRSLQEEKQGLVDKLSGTQKDLEKKIDDFNKAITEAQAEIRRKEEENNKNNGKYNGKFEGLLEWPISYNYNIITSIFGPRTAPTAGASTNHGAIDIGVSYVPVYAPADGKVTIASYVSGYGNYIKIDHGNGYYTAFGHLSAYKVSEGDIVSKGQQIAVSGNTGITTGPHLHYEVYKGGSSKGYRVDPLQYTSHPSLIYR